MEKLKQFGQMEIFYTVCFVIVFILSIIYNHYIFVVLAFLLGIFIEKEHIEYKKITK